MPSIASLDCQQPARVKSRKSSPVQFSGLDFPSASSLKSLLSSATTDSLSCADFINPSRSYEAETGRYLNPTTDDGNLPKSLIGLRRTSNRLSRVK
jgi:hypothetical protein